jgi:hypothetical protein
MSFKIEEWIERMRQAQNPGPVTRITACRNNRDIGWVYDIDEDTNIGELAERIDNAGRDAGFSSYELRAFDDKGRFIAPLQHKIEQTQIVQLAPSAPPTLPMGVEATVVASLKNNRSFASLGLDAVLKAQQMTERIMDILKEENAELRRENEKLREKLVEHWEMMEKINTHEAESKYERDRIERMGRMGETFTTALMGRVFGGQTTPEGQSIEYKMAMSIFRSLGNDLGRANQILALLSEEERVIVMELIRAQQQQQEKAGAQDTPKPNGVAAASAAAAANAGAAGNAS